MSGPFATSRLLVSLFGSAQVVTFPLDDGHFFIPWTR